jgi:hypothetical protein
LHGTPFCGKLNFIPFQWFFQPSGIFHFIQNKMGIFCLNQDLLDFRIYKMGNHRFILFIHSSCKSWFRLFFANWNFIMPPLRGWVWGGFCFSIIISSLRDYLSCAVLHFAENTSFHSISMILSTLRDFSFHPKQNGDFLSKSGFARF